MKPEEVEEQLKQYIFHTRGSQYAVLVTGSWGGGKTHFIRNFIKIVLPNWRLNELNLYDPIPSAYVSLNGKSTIDQIQIELLSQTDPNQFNVARGAEFLIEGTLAQARIRRPINIIKQLKFPSNTVIFFDDLERWSGKLSEIMGFINRLVEHEKLKVVVVADEDVLNSQGQDNKIHIKNSDAEIIFESQTANTFKSIKEKTIGKTFKFEQNYESLFNEFIKSVSVGSCQEYLKSIQESIFEIFHKSDINNLRILRRSIEDYQHFWNKLDVKKVVLDENFTRFTLQFFMYLFDFKKGFFTKQDLIDYNQYRIGRNAENQQNLDRLSEKYDNVIRYDFYSASKEFWVSAILDGHVRDELLHETMSNSGYYSHNTRPLWIELWYYWKLPASDFRLLVEKTKQSINLFKFNISGHVLHIFLILKSLDKQNIISYKNALDKGREYIDRLYEKDLLEPWEFEASNFQMFSFGGLSFFDSDSDETKDFVLYMENKRKEKTLSKLKEESLKLLQQLKNKPILFCERIKQAGENSDLYKTPIFSEVDVIEFWNAVINLDPEMQKSVLYSIQLRYKHQAFTLNELMMEREFLETAKAEFDNRLANLDPLDQVRLTIRVKETLEGSINIFNEYQRKLAE